MPAKPILNVRLAPETLRKLDMVAAVTRRTRSFIANEALEAWVDREMEILEDLRIGLEEGRTGKTVPHEKAMRQIDVAIDRAAKRKASRNGRRP
jgi:predicted transcriptional regulator